MNGDWKIANIALSSPAKADKSSSIDKLLVIYRGLKILTAWHKLRAPCLALGPRAAGINRESGQEQELWLHVWLKGTVLTSAQLCIPMHSKCQDTSGAAPPAVAAGGAGGILKEC